MTLKWIKIVAGGKGDENGGDGRAFHIDKRQRVFFHREK
jgi:hypothetical protein